MKKSVICFAMLLMALSSGLAPISQAATLNDVSSDFWAYEQINEMVDDEVMKLNLDGNFNPEDKVQRAEFTSMLIKVLKLDNMDVVVDNPFSDITLTTEYYDDILRSEQKGLVYGYPDNTFRPSNDIKKQEVTSVMSHITKGADVDTQILSAFHDVSKIPDWAKEAYAKTTLYKLYVNYPDSMEFEPQRNITRAETAVLLSKLKAALSLVKQEYKAPVDVEKTIGEEHLSINSDALSNIVTITNKRMIVEQGNILKAGFRERFKGKKAAVGDTIVFTNVNDIVTDEGRTIIPSGSKFFATVEDMILPKPMNKSGAVKLHFNKLETSDGKVCNLDADVYSKFDGWLQKSSLKKLGLYTLGGLAAGGAVGSAAGIPTDEEGVAYGVGLPVGAALGLLTGWFTKGSYYNAHEGEEVYMYLNSPLSIKY